MSTPPMPAGIAALPRHAASGLPIPWFVQQVPGKTLDFRVISPQALALSLKNDLCWVCGRRNYPKKFFAGGPLSAAQARYVDPPMHWACAYYAVRVCPFMACPEFQRREADMRAYTPMAPTAMTVLANPEVTVLTAAPGYEVIAMGEAAVLTPTRITDYRWFTRGRVATRAEAEAAIRQALQRPELVRLDASRRRPIEQRLERLPRPAARPAQPLQDALT